jgi:hypothetical protein
MRLRNVVALCLVAILQGCGQEEPVVQTVAQSSSQPALSSRQVPKVTLPEGQDAPEWREVQKVLEEPLVRLAYGDRTGLWENEFEYLHEQETFDQYIQHGEIQWANVDSLLRVEIQEITFFEDSANLHVNFVFLDAAGNENSSLSPMQLYRHKGRWIKPYLSSPERQHDYDDLIRRAKEDSEEDW